MHWGHEKIEERVGFVVFFFLLWQNFSDSLLLSPQGFVFIQIFQLIPMVAHMEISLFGSPGI